MRALLVNPWIHDFAAYDLWSKPLGLLRIAASLKALGCEVRLVDCLDRFHPRLKKFLKGRLPKSTRFGSGHYYSEFIHKPEIFKDLPRRFKRYGLPKELFERLIREEPEPDIILVSSGMTYWYPGTFEAVRALRGRFPRVPLVLGGIYARLCTQHAREKSGADIVYSGHDIRQILDLVGEVTRTSFDYARLGKVTRLFPSYELYPKFAYVTLRTSRGCPFRCSYCGWYLLEEGFSQEDPLSVAHEIEHFSAAHRIRNFSFYDEALLYNAESHLMRVLKHVLERKIRAYFHTPNGLHIKFISPELARLMKRAGFVQPRLGLETSSSVRQRETGGKVTNAEFLRAVNRLKDAGYESSEIGVNILIGLPGQSVEEARDTIHFAASRRLRLFLEEYSPIPHTPEYERSGLPADADPLLHNNSAFPLYRQDGYHEFQELKELAHRFNESIGSAYSVI